MKKIILLGITTLFVSVSYSQSIRRQVIGATGATLSDRTNISIDFMLGEMAITTVNDEETSIFQGFHKRNHSTLQANEVQMDIQRTLIDSNENVEDVDFSMYPNPIKDELLVIQFVPLERQKITVTIRNILGQTIYHKDYSTTENRIRLDTFQTMPSGIYVVEFFTGNKRIVKRIVKQ